MGVESAAAVLRSFQQIVRAETVRELTDGQLLERFVSCGDEAAFAMLVRRHGPMVQGVCQRLLRHTQDAEDAFQATFLVLVRKAQAVGRPDLLGHWLYGVAVRVSAKARAVAARRRARELLSPELPDAHASKPALLSDWPIIDEEIRRLPAKYRVPFVLCYLDGMTNEEAAHRLKCPKGTLQSRLAWARERLRIRLIRRGVAPSAILFAALSSSSPSSAVPISLLRDTARAARAFGGWASAADVMPARAAILARGVLHAMFLSKLKIVTVVLLLGLLPLAGTSFWLRQAPAAEPIAAAPEDPPKPPQDPPSSPLKKRDGNFTAREVLKKSFSTGATPRLVVETFNGSINVTAKSGNTVAIQVTKRSNAKTQEEADAELKNIEVTMKQEEDGVHVTAKRLEQHPHVNAGAAAELEVPPGAVLDLRSSNGAVTVTGGTGAAKVETSNGSIRAKEHTGPLNLHSSNGPLTVTGGTGRMDLRTSNGALNIQAEKAIVTGRTSNGSIHFSGSLAEGEDTFHTSNGSITLTLPKESSFRIDADTSLGRVSTSFHLQERTSDSAAVDASAQRIHRKTHLHGKTADKPSFSLKLHTSNGSISVNESQSTGGSVRTEKTP
jgi:RNA polymerase sigma factor (sigma-70 family)